MNIPNLAAQKIFMCSRHLSSLFSDGSWRMDAAAKESKLFWITLVLRAE